MKRIRRVFSASFVSFLLGAIISLSPIRLPVFLLSVMGYLGSMTTPLSMLLTGSILAKMGRDAFKLSKAGLATLGGRFIISPIICLAVCLLASMPVQMVSVYVVQSALPSMNQVVLISKYYGANEKLSAQMMSVTTLLSVILIPLFVAVMNILLPI